MIVRIARAKVGHRQAPLQAQSPSRITGEGLCASWVHDRGPVPGRKHAPRRIWIAVQLLSTHKIPCRYRGVFQCRLTWGAHPRSSAHAQAATTVSHRPGVSNERANPNRGGPFYLRFQIADLLRNANTRLSRLIAPDKYSRAAGQREPKHTPRIAQGGALDPEPPERRDLMGVFSARLTCASAQVPSELTCSPLSVLDLNRKFAKID
jgi:hypothetical protein